MVGWGLAKDLVKYITQGINNFRKVPNIPLLYHDNFVQFYLNLFLYICLDTSVHDVISASK